MYGTILSAIHQLPKIAIIPSKGSSISVFHLSSLRKAADNLRICQMCDEVKRLPAEPMTPISSTQPPLTSLPFPAQHRVLQVLQQRLERSAFESIQKWQPQLGQSNGWDCAEKVELHMAFRALERKSRTHSASQASIIPKKGLNRLRADIEGIRHAAVHRQLHDHRRLLHQIRSAREFATVWLGDPQCGMEIEQC